MREQDLFLRRAIEEAGALPAERLDACSALAREKECDLAQAIIDLGALSARRLALIRADVCEVPFVEPADYDVSYDNTRLLPRAVAEKHCVFPLFFIDGVLTVGTDDPMNLVAMDQVRQFVHGEVDAVLCPRESLQALIARAYSLSRAAPDAVAAGGETVELDATAARLESDSSSQPVVAAVNQLLADAAEQAASDIHVNPDEHELRIRYRIDGVLHERQGPPLSMHAGIVQRLKVIANLDLTQTRRPQDGKFRFRHAGRSIEVRMSTLPTVCGENVVLRLLADRQAIDDFRSLGMPEDIVAGLEEIITRPYGMLLATGPTGSGKTTTLYTALNRLNRPDTNIITIEDPVEIRLPYLRQVQVNHSIGLTFAAALRSILRQDPDVVLVGEIRDNETATIALQAALTGHMVLSTVHTNDAPGAVTRLRDFGLPDFIINSALLGVVAQRLVRRVCAHCVVPDQPEPALCRRFGIEPGAAGFQRGRGCTRCGRAGYKGRVGLYEYLRFTPKVQQAVERSDGVDRIREVAESLGMRAMWRDGMEKARLGLTTLEEVARATMLAENAELRIAA